MCTSSISPWGHRNSMRFSPMSLSICEKVISNLQLAIGSLQALWLPPPSKNRHSVTTSSPSSLPIQTDSQHACQSQRNRSEANFAFSMVMKFQDNWKNGLTGDQKESRTLTTTTISITFRKYPALGIWRSC